MEVRVVHTLPTCHRPETDYVRVHTCTAPFDDTVTLANGIYLANAIPEATLHEIRGEGHWLIYEHFGEILANLHT